MDELELQLKKFPRGKHDDIIDALQMLYDMYSLQPNSKTYINHSIKDITKFICDNHFDEFGNELSPNTIRTYLSPTSNDKEPNNDAKIRL